MDRRHSLRQRILPAELGETGEVSVAGDKCRAVGNGQGSEMSVRSQVARGAGLFEQFPQ